jgi:hypothetical protein
VREGVQRDAAPPVFELAARRKFAIDDEVRHLEIVRFLGEHIDRIAAVLENPRVAVYVRHGAPARRGVRECRIVAHQAEIILTRLYLPQIHAVDHLVVDDLDLVGATGPAVGDGEMILALVLRPGTRLGPALRLADPPGPFRPRRELPNLPRGPLPDLPLDLRHHDLLSAPGEVGGPAG